MVPVPPWVRLGGHHYGQFLALNFKELKDNFKGLNFAYFPSPFYITVFKVAFIMKAPVSLLA